MAIQAVKLTRVDYELLDFGDGRKLEAFGGRVIDRPCPAAADKRPSTNAWSRADARFEADRIERGAWRGGPAPEDWRLAVGEVQLSLKQGDFGHVGAFPEHAPLWDLVAQAAAASPGLRMLNLFAYTGAASLAAAAHGAEVAHVDAARSTVDWARRNADASGLCDAPIRWIVDDAAKFVAREVRRGRTYDAVVLDPPTFGLGAGGRRWSIDKSLENLLDGCRSLTGPSPRLVALSCHTLGYGPKRLASLLVDRWPERRADCRTMLLEARSAPGDCLTLGAAAVLQAEATS